jgi:hypothetical protein
LEEFFSKAGPKAIGRPVQQWRLTPVAAGEENGDDNRKKK